MRLDRNKKEVTQCRGCVRARPKKLIYSIFSFLSFKNIVFIFFNEEISQNERRVLFRGEIT